MKKLLAVVMFSLLLSGCGMMNMVVTERPAEVYAKPDKALLIIVRDTFFGSDSVFHNYLDGRMIGDTIGESWFLTEVSPGPHHVVAVGGGTIVTRIDFQPGKIYSLRQNVSMGPWRPQPRSFWPISQAETAALVKSCSYLELASGMGYMNMDHASYEDALNQYHSELKSNPYSYQSMQEYIGF